MKDYVHWLFLLILFVTMLGSIQRNKLTVAGAFTAGVVGCCVFAGAGFTGIAMIGLFFILGILATSWKKSIKERFGAAEKHKGRRNAGQVFANGGAAAIFGLLAYISYDHRHLFQLMMAASLSSATADTLSSELGMVYGKRFYNILDFQKGKRGENGVVSIEGTLLGIIGSVIIAIVFATGYEWNRWFIWIVVAGTLGNIADSVLGATLEKRNYLNNNTVNFLNTFAAAVFIWALAGTV